MDEAAALLEHHREAWLGPFAGVAQPGSDIWHGGFLRGFTPRRNPSLPSPTHPAWSTVETLNLWHCGLEAALPVIDAVQIPLRRLLLNRWSELRLLACRPSQRRTLGYVSITNDYTEPEDTRFYGPIRLAIGTLEVRSSWRIPPWKSWRAKPPGRLLIPVWWHKFATRFDPLFQSAVEARREAGATVRMTYLQGSFQAMTLDLDPVSTSLTLFMRDGHCLVPKVARAQIADLEPQVIVVGAMGPRTHRRLLGRFPEAILQPGGPALRASR